MAEQDIFLSVIVPAYNETRNFKSGALDTLMAYLTKQDYAYEVIIVDDGSTDDTAKMLVEWAKKHTHVHVIENPHQGKALTVKSGMLAAIGSNRLYTDFDQSTPISEIEKLLPYREQGVDVVIGSREISGARREDEPFHRHLMGKGFNLIVRLFTAGNIHDTQCGFKLFSDQATLKLFEALKVTTSPKQDAFTGAFDVELLYLARKHGYTIVEVPVHWHHEASVRVNPIRDSLRMLWEVVNIRFYDLFKGYH